MSACPALLLPSLGASQIQEVVSVKGEGGEGQGEVDPVEHWWLPQPGQPDVQLHAGCGEPLLVHCGAKGDSQLRKILMLKLEAQGWLQSQASPWSCHQQLQQTR